MVKWCILCYIYFTIIFKKLLKDVLAWGDVRDFSVFLFVCLFAFKSLKLTFLQASNGKS